MDLVVAVALGLLTVVVAAALIGLTFIIRYKFCGKNKEQDVEELVERPSPGLSHISEEIRLSELGICDDDVQRIVQSFQWEADIKGLIPHCLAILQTCYNITERLVSQTLLLTGTRPNENLEDLLKVARTIGPRIDDIARAMKSPLDPRVVEARCAVLVSIIEHMSAITKQARGKSLPTKWTGEDLTDLVQHLQVLRTAVLEWEKENNNSFRDGVVCAP